MFYRKEFCFSIHNIDDAIQCLVFLILSYNMRISLRFRNFLRLEDFQYPHLFFNNSTVWKFAKSESFLRVACLLFYLLLNINQNNKSTLLFMRMADVLNFEQKI